MWKLIEKIDISQGSETGAVVYYLGSSVSWQNWQHVYTAVTRGKKEVHILGTHLVLSKAIAAKPNVRWTSLKYQLNKILPVSWSFYSPWSLCSYCEPTFMWVQGIFFKVHKSLVVANVFHHEPVLACLLVPVFYFQDNLRLHLDIEN